MNSQKILSSSKKEPTIQEIGKFRQNFKKKQANIEKKFIKSVVNKLYIFPRNMPEDTSTITSSSEQQISTQYNLKHQNLKNRKNQVELHKKQYRHNKIQVTNKHDRTTSLKSLHEPSIINIEQVNAKKTIKTHKAKNIEISFDTRKKTPNKKINYNSMPKLLVESYGSDQRGYSSTKRSSKALLISFRATKNKDINVSLSGKRVKTEVY